MTPRNGEILLLDEQANLRNYGEHQHLWIGNRLKSSSLGPVQDKLILFMKQ